MQVSREEEILENLKAMFPSVDKPVIQLLLEQNGLSEERTIDALLQMTSSPSPPAKLSSEGALPATPLPSESPALGSSQQQIHDDELLAKALQRELRISDGRPVNNEQVTKAVHQLESDEALAISLQNDVFMEEDVSQERGQAQRRRGGNDDGVSNESEDEDDKVFEDVAKGFNETIDTVGQKLESFGKVLKSASLDVSNAWSSFTTVVGAKINETLNQDPPDRPNAPQLIVRTASHKDEEDDVATPFLDPSKR